MNNESLLFCASEVYPFAKTGGLADVAHSLPRALRDTYNIKVVMPLYSCINRKKYSIKSLKKSFLFMVAAISDYIPKESFKGKLKKEQLGETWSLKLSKNIDILATFNKSEIYAIGFKAEMDKKEAKSNAQNMLKNKNLDAVCLNILDESNAFGSDTNKIELILKDKSFDFYGNKLNISLEILNRFEKEFTNE